MQDSLATFKFYRLALALCASLSLTLAACAGGAATSVPTAVPVVATATARPASIATPESSPAAGGPLRLVLASDGNTARFRVTEQLASLSLPSDAVGETNDVTGQIVLAADGTVVSDESKFVVDLTTLETDSSMRDGFIQSNTLETSTYPNAEFVPTSVVGLPSPLPTSGSVTFQLVGDMTLHGTTKTLTWDVTAEIVGQELVGTAKTSFTFGDFGLTIPRVGRVLSIEDNIRLEYDFRLVAQ